jgi:chromosome segregation ATPase
MTLDQWVESFETRLHGLGRSLWQSPSTTRLEEQAARLREDLCQRSRELSRCERQRQETSLGIATLERRASHLTRRIEVYFRVADQALAWQHALELDRVSQSLRQDRERLSHLNSIRQRLQAQMDHFECCLSEVEEKLRLARN